MSTLPTLFLSHGSPDIAIADIPASQFLKRLGASLPRPRAILVASAHFESPRVLVTSDEAPETIHDFGGFDPRLHEMRYAAPGDPELAQNIVERLSEAGIDAALAPRRGFDHGTWVPLILAYPEADIPVIQVSVDPDKGPAHAYAVGRALAQFRNEGVLVIGSGSFTHNLGEAFSRIRTGARTGAMPDWVSGFTDWMADRLTAGAVDDLIDYRRKAPFARENHPTDEHLLPLYVALGAAGAAPRTERLHDSHDFGVLAMDAFAFH